MGPRGLGRADKSRSICLPRTYKAKQQEETVMRLRSVLTGIAFVSVIAMASSAFAQSDCTKLVPASPFGKDDQTGATNRITPAVTKAAATEIKDGKVIA